MTPAKQNSNLVLVVATNYPSPQESLVGICGKIDLPDPHADIYTNFKSITYAQNAGAIEVPANMCRN